MIFDTGSNWLWIDSIHCKNCPPQVPKFDEMTSPSFLYDKTPRSLYYGSGSVSTYKSWD